MIHNQHVIDRIEFQGTIATNHYIRGFIDDLEYSSKLCDYNVALVKEKQLSIDLDGVDFNPMFDGLLR